MLRAVPHPALFCADVAALPVCDGVFDVMLAADMLYHVPDRQAAVSELRRVLTPAGVCIAVTNGGDHLRPLRALVERAVREGTPGWSMKAAIQAFTAENAAAQLGCAFASVTPVRPAQPAAVVIRDASVVADYVASWAGFYRDQVAPSLGGCRRRRAPGGTGRDRPGRHLHGVRRPCRLRMPLSAAAVRSKATVPGGHHRPGGQLVAADHNDRRDYGS